MGHSYTLPTVKLLFATARTCAYPGCATPLVHIDEGRINGIRWRVRTGAPWRDVPVEYGPWQTVYGLLRRWQRDGTWRKILTCLQARADAAGLITWDVSVDSTVARAHQHAAGARKRGICRPSRPAGQRPSRPATLWAAPAAG